MTLTTKDDLLKTFGQRSFVVLAILVLALGWVVTARLSDAITDQAGRTASAVANALVLDKIDTPVRGPLDDSAADALDRVLEQSATEEGILAVKLWDPAGTLAYSSDAADPIGTDFSDDVELQHALAGETEVEVALVAEAENSNQFAATGALMEVYSPLLTSSGEVGGVFEVYLPYAPIAAQIRTTSLLVWAVLIAGALLAYGAQVGLVRRAAARMREVERRADKAGRGLAESLGQIEENSMGTLAGLVNAVDAKDSYTASHSLAVAEYSTAIGVELGLPQADRRLLERAALLHDVGKLGTPEAILLKSGRLEPVERDIVQEHSEIGARIVEAIPFLEDLVPAIRHHHERWDGGGYPAGIAGDDIPLFARILAVADAFDAMTSDRPYRKALSIDEALWELIEHRGTQFYPDAVNALIRAVGHDTALVPISSGHRISSTHA